MVIIQEYQSSILELIENIEHKQNQSFRDNTVLPIYKDLYYVLNWMERIPNISFLTQLEFE